MQRGFSKLLIVGGVGLIVVVGAVVYFRSAGPKTTYQTAKVERGSVVQQVTATGSIAPKSKITLQPEVSGQVVSIPVKEGDEVKAGDLIVGLDDKDISAQILAQKAAIATAQAKLAELVAGPTKEELDLAQRAVDTANSKLSAAQTAEQDAQVALTNAQTNLENTKAKDGALITAKLTAFIADLQSASDDADSAVNTLLSPMYTSDGFLTFTVSSAQAKTNAESTRISAVDAVSVLEDAASSVHTDGSDANVQAQYQIAARNLAVVQGHADASVKVLNYTVGLSDTTLATYKANSGTAQSSITAIASKLEGDSADLDLQEKVNEADVTGADITLANAEAALNTAKKAVDTAKNALAEAQASLAVTQSGSRPEAIAAQRAAVSAEQAKLVGLQADLAKRHITAPVDGTVARIDVEIGDTVQPGSQIGIMNSKGRFEIVANISEIDIANVKLDDPVDVTLDAFPSDQHWTGKVSSIQPAETVIDNVIFYETHVLFDKEDPRLRSGMTANLTVTTQQKDDVLRIPMSAVKEDGARTYVDVLENGAPKEVDVKLGLRSTDYAEVLGGLKEGDLVVTGTATK